MSRSDLLPTLKLVPTGSIRFHERPERRRTLKLVARLRDEGVLRNPPIIADIGDGNYLLLDGANRVSAFRELGCPEVPAQIVDYSDQSIALRGWHHLLLDPAGLDLRSKYGAIEGVELREISAAALSSALEFRQVFAVYVDHEASPWGLFPSDAAPSLSARMRVLTAVISCYENDSPLERVKLANYDDLPSVVQRQAFELCLFPTLTKEELLELVRANQLIPTGISRHLIPGRVLGLSVKLDFLRSMASAEQRQEHFKAHVEGLQLAGRVRYYEEPVFILNE
ncbi:MAG: hypothetical protein ACI9W2_001130 [Gammaproteobacteria bacterium]|jgi:hypothetical protein